MKNIYYLLRQEMYDQRKRAAIYGGVIFLIIFISRLVEESANRLGAMQDFTEYRDSVGVYLFLVGFIFISMTFARSMHSRTGQHAWLMTPVHAHEKLAAKIINHSLVYPAALVIFMSLSTLITEGAMWLIWKHTVPVLNPVDPVILKMIAHYIVGSSFFLMGASYFKSAHFIKSILSVLLMIFVLTLVTGTIFVLAYREYFDLMMNSHFEFDETMFLNLIDAEKWERRFRITGNIIHWGITAPLFWTVTYFRIREKEAKDAV